VAPVGQSAPVATMGLLNSLALEMIGFVRNEHPGSAGSGAALVGRPSAFLVLGRRGPLQSVACVCWHTVRRRVEPKPHNSDYQRQGFMASSRHDVIGGNPCSAITLDSPANAKDCKLTPSATAS